ncbi:hypothetical protein QRX50_37170 [Amycolatopsis carbonis]|uniref:Uncharacterized protein n=1 Tax=Amycolatopsis carbonis TaxID=715471 RepID=A0A9Y2MVK7_9PSEU|nr:hypothetical protein [Amycolatopsis sp. 2-15]WIX77004.1 hypothetical protein QRX50_37170 [Amycolatopsis sp. 2-15]
MNADLATREDHPVGRAVDSFEPGPEERHRPAECGENGDGRDQGDAEEHDEEEWRSDTLTGEEQGYPADHERQWEKQARSRTAARARVELAEHR